MAGRECALCGGCGGGDDLAEIGQVSMDFCLPGLRVGICARSGMIDCAAK
jgi:hypothetical protein